MSTDNKPYIINGTRVSRDEYNKNKLDSILFRVPKGKKDIIKRYAESNGESLNGFINRVIDEEIQSGLEKTKEEKVNKNENTN